MSVLSRAFRIRFLVIFNSFSEEMKRIALIAGMICTCSFAVGQDDDEQPTTLEDRFGDLSVGGGFGVAYFHGDLGRGSKEVSDQAAYFLTFDKRFNPSISAMGNLIYGRLGNDDFSLEAPHNNFVTNFFQADIRVAYHLDNGDILPDNSKVSSFVSAGFGAMFFNPKSDMVDWKGREYHYWSTGSIYDRPQNDPDAENAVALDQDHVYETTIHDSISFSKVALVIPVTVGVKMRLVNNFEAQLGFTYNLGMSDYIDGWKYDGNGDNYFMASIAVSYHIGKWMGKKIDYSDVNFRQIKTDDQDGDGIIDFSDNCPHTPGGVEVDLKGCPVDSDKDGVADYLDTEPNTEPGAHVNEWGETMSEEEINNLFDPFHEHDMDVIESTHGEEEDENEEENNEQEE